MGAPEQMLARGVGSRAGGAPGAPSRPLLPTAATCPHCKECSIAAASDIAAKSTGWCQGGWAAYGCQAKLAAAASRGAAAIARPLLLPPSKVRMQQLGVSAVRRLRGREGRSGRISTTSSSSSSQQTAQAQAGPNQPVCGSTQHPTSPQCPNPPQAPPLPSSLTCAGTTICICLPRPPHPSSHQPPVHAALLT